MVMKTEIAKVGSDVELTESESDFFDHFQEITWERRPDIIFDRALNKFAVDRGVHYINFRKHGFWTQPVYLDTGLDNFSAHSSTHIARINCALLYTFGKYTFTFTHLEATATFDVLAGGGAGICNNLRLMCSTGLTRAVMIFW
jgi:hypothetical protein